MTHSSKHRRRINGALPAAALAGALGATLWLGGPSTRSVTAQDTASLTAEQRAMASSLEGAFIRIADTVKPATVSITTTVETEEGDARVPSVPPGLEDSPFGDLFPFGRPPRRGPGPASGSGVIVREDGYILTNDHVVAGTRDNTVRVTLNDGRRLRGKVFRDQRSDLAVVKVDAGKPLPYVRFTDSNRVRVGQWAVAIGSPFGQQNTMTAGIVSALHRSTAVRRGEGRYYPNLIQTDASINQGNSGGPLLNINGELMGINVLIYSPSGGSVGLGYAIPANTAKTVMEQLITRGRVVRGYLGLQPEDVPVAKRDALRTEGGARVRSVSPDTPADKGGIRAGDVVTRFGARQITSEVDLRDAISATAPGTSVPVTVLRNGEPRTLQVTVGSAPEESVASAPTPTRRASDRLGMRLETLTSEAARELKLDPSIKGVRVTNVSLGSPAAEAGLTPRDVIIAVNGRPVTSDEAINRVIAVAKPDDLVTVTVLRVEGDNSKPTETVVDIEVP